MTTNTEKRNEGMALLVAMIFLVMMGLLATWATSRVMDNTRHVEKHIDYQDTFEGLEAALGRAQAELNSGEDGMVGVDPGFNFADGFPVWGDAEVVPESMTTAPNVEYFAFSLDWATDGIDNNGDGNVDTGVEEDGYFTTYAFARVNRNGSVTALRGAEQVFQADIGGGTSIWDNAIFAGSGQAGNLINGNVTIHGSVHILGDALDPGDLAMDMSGNSGIFNNYGSLSADLRGRVPPLEQVSFGGEMVETLNATFRVKNGMVSTNGSNTIGTADQSGNSVKETLDAVYVSDGWTGNKTDGNGDPSTVHSDNGWDDGYDLGNQLAYPTYDDDGGRDHLDYYTETDPNPAQGFQQVHVGNLNIQAGGGNFYWNATTGTKVVNKNPGSNGMPTKAQLNPNHYYVWFDDSTDTMVINGRIPVQGNLGLLSGNGNNNKLINYEGKGTFLAFDPNNANGGDVTVNVSLKTTAFPNTNLLGVHAQDDFSIGTSSQLEIMGGFYAQDGIIVNKQTIIMGTIVGDYFDLGGQVPDIYQVPELQDAWTEAMRMIGTNPQGGDLTLVPLSWRELSIL